jgi:hypothetical protein
MNIAIIQFASASIHFAASLEILKKESISNVSAFYCVWGAQTKLAGRMSANFETLSGAVPNKIQKLLLTANPNVIINNKMMFDEIWVAHHMAGLLKELEALDSLPDLRRLEFEGVNPGSAIASELATITKNAETKLQKHESLIRILIRSYLEVYSATMIFYSKCHIDGVHLYNGRFLHERAVWDASKRLNVKVLLFETTRNRYFQRKEGFHNRLNNQKVMLDHWYSAEETLEEKIKIGSRYFSELRSSSNPFSSSTHSRVEVEKPYFVYFSSSDDELVGFWDQREEKLGNQLQCVRTLQNYFDRQSNFNLIIRVHPNLKNKSQEVIEKWESLESSHMTRVFKAQDTISSYALLDGSIGSISFGSTMCIEAAFSNKPSLVLSDCGYDEIGAVDKGNTWQEVANWIESGHLLSEVELQQRKIHSCIRGYFLATAGLKFQHTLLEEKGWGAWEATQFMSIKISETILFRKYRTGLNRVKLFLSLKYAILRGK